MLELINRDRKANDLNPVAWDIIAASAGRQHAQEMADLGYLSHWNIDGSGPDLRYATAGGLDLVQENVYGYRSWKSDGSAVPITDWSEIIADAQKSLMASEGHRANILSPEHTHVGIGVAYNAATGDVRIAQEFVNRFVQVSPLPRRARPGDRLVLRGALLSGSSDPMVNLAYEPFPTGLTLAELNATRTFASPAKHVSTIPVVVDNKGTFIAEFKLDSPSQAGIYHVRLWVKREDGKPVPAVDGVIEVR